MKILNSLITAGALLGCGLATATAQQAPVAQPVQTAFERATELTGATVADNDDRQLGSVDDIVVNLETGEVAYLLASPFEATTQTDGFLRAVPPEAVNLTREASPAPGALTAQISLTPAAWQQAPTVRRDQIARLNTAELGSRIYQHYGLRWESRAAIQYGSPPPREHQGPRQRPDRQDVQYGQSAQRETSTTERMGEDRRETGATEPPGRPRREAGATAPPGEPRREAGATEPPGERQRQAGTVERDERVETEIEIREEPPRSQTGVRPDTADTPVDASPPADRSISPAHRPGQLLLSSAILEQEVWDAEQAPIGQISDLLVDLPQGRVTYVLVRLSPQFLEADADQVFALAPQAFHAPSAEQIELHVTEEHFQEAAPLTEEEFQRRARETPASAERARTDPAVFRFDEEQAGTFGASPGGRGPGSTGQTDPQP